MGFPTVHPFGVTRHDPALAWGGYTLFQAPGVGALLIDMQGREVKLWRGLQGFPNSLLPGGEVLGSTGQRDPRLAFQDQVDVVQVDWDGRIVWRHSRGEWVEDAGTPPRWVARQHHDLQREGNPVGYPAPGQLPRTREGHTLLLVHENRQVPAISDHPLLDDALVEIGWDGQELWRWRAADHVEELGFDAEARAALRRQPTLRTLASGAVGDWLHLNAATRLGPNRHFDAGDARFHPDNVMISAREANLLAIVERASGRIVWRLGPRYDGNEAERRLGWIIGQHHAHLIPRGLPGEGNLLVFDNGGWAGYGAPHPGAPDGTRAVQRDHSRVLEIDPRTLAIVWQYTPAEAGFVVPLDAFRFYSPFVSSAQRLANGNTLITEGADGRLIEVTPEHRIVWEYLSPYRGQGALALHLIYRAIRYPYDWVPQLPVPEAVAITPPGPEWRLPGAAPAGPVRDTAVEAVEPTRHDTDYCVNPQRPLAGGVSAAGGADGYELTA